MSSKINEKVDEEQILASPSPVCTRCQVLKQKITFNQKKISWLRRSKSKLKDMSRKVNSYKYFMTRATMRATCMRRGWCNFLKHPICPVAVL